MTASEIAKAIVERDGGEDYYYEGWATEESITEAIQGAIDHVARERDRALRSARAWKALARLQYRMSRFYRRANEKEG